MQQRLNKIKERLKHASEEKLLQEGKEKLVLNSILKLQRKAEIIYFSIQRRARDISKVAGMLQNVKIVVTLNAFIKASLHYHSFCDRSIL
jgi:transcriptional regulator NrdR family protein